jgi:hypothetical protein
MKKLIGLAVILLLSCQKDPTVYVSTPYALEIAEASGLKLESYIVNDRVQVNVKLPDTGQYRIKIFDFTDKLVSQEIINGKQGDNILNVYVNALPPSSYTISLYDNNKLIGKEFFTNE